MMSERDFFGTIPTQIALGNHDLELLKADGIIVSMMMMNR